jgi:hypothetical protein
MPAFVLAVTVLLAQAEATNPSKEAEPDKVQFERWQKYYKSVAAEYEMQEGRESPVKLKLQPEPVFTYANPAGGNRSHGAMFIWTRDGRPEILGAIWSGQSGDRRSVVHSLHSLALEPLTATRKRDVFWAPEGPGIEPFLIPGAPEPAATAPLRLNQMRNIARDFSAATVRDTVERQLQFRPQPVYRWEMPTTKRDGAVFVWFEDWDPELLMVLETGGTADGPRWHAGFARFTNLPVSARHKDRRVWSFEESPAEDAFGGFDKRYNSAHGVDVLPAVRGE